MRAVQVLTEQQTESVVLSWQRNLVVLPDNENYFNEKFPGKGNKYCDPTRPQHSSECWYNADAEELGGITYR